MGKPYWGYENYLMGSTVTARTASSVYPATNLGLYTMHRYRSASKCVVLDGVADYFWIADAAWNSYTGDFCFEFWFRPNAVDVSGRIIDKWGAAGQRAFYVSQSNDDLRVGLSSNGTDTASTVTFNDVLSGGAYDHFKLCYNCLGANLGLYKNSIESGRVINTTTSGTASITGAVPTSLYDGTTNLGIGADNAGANCLAGKLGFVAFGNGPNDNGGYLQPSLCKAYYAFDNSDGSDSSGNGRTLTAVSLDSGDYANTAAYQRIGFQLPAEQNPTVLFLDRRHNLTSTATVKLLRSGWYGSYNLIASESVTAGQPVVSRFSTSANMYWWLEINDPNNSNGYIEIPFVYLGSHAAMERAHLRGYDHSEFMPGNQQTDVLGNPDGYIRGGQAWAKGLTFRCNATDFSTMQSVWDEAGRNRPVVFCEDVDNEDTETWLVKIPNMKYSHIYTTNRFVKADVQEVAVGL